jgi:Histone-like transcription factor (CBF/NF-Y) and archaeal histone
VKKILKLDHDVKNVSKEAIVAITKATELFVAYMVRI